jgi:hypothetical protein
MSAYTLRYGPGKSIDITESYRVGERAQLPAGVFADVS